MTHDKYTEKPFGIKGRFIVYRGGVVVKRWRWLDYKRYNTFEQVLQAWEHHKLKKQKAPCRQDNEKGNGIIIQYKPFFEDEKHS
jgi:hypothetical protein